MGRGSEISISATIRRMQSGWTATCAVAVDGELYYRPGNASNPHTAIARGVEAGMRARSDAQRLKREMTRGKAACSKRGFSRPAARVLTDKAGKQWPYCAECWTEVYDRGVGEQDYISPAVNATMPQS